MGDLWRDSSGRWWWTDPFTGETVESLAPGEVDIITPEEGAAILQGRGMGAGVDDAGPVGNDLWRDSSGRWWWTDPFTGETVESHAPGEVDIITPEEGAAILQGRGMGAGVVPAVSPPTTLPITLPAAGIVPVRPPAAAGGVPVRPPTAAGIVPVRPPTAAGIVPVRPPTAAGGVPVRPPTTAKGVQMRPTMRPTLPVLTGKKGGMTMPIPALIAGGIAAFRGAQAITGALRGGGPRVGDSLEGVLRGAFADDEQPAVGMDAGLGLGAGANSIKTWVTSHQLGPARGGGIVQVQHMVWSTRADGRMNRGAIRMADGTIRQYAIRRSVVLTANPRVRDLRRAAGQVFRQTKALRMAKGRADAAAADWGVRGAAKRRAKKKGG